ncbi:MAG TPA: tRNA pseudouridine(55) synthase TruB [Gammaproteobacteria bacterium]
MGNRRRPGRDVTGILLLDKPRGSTSNRALQQAKRLFRAAKAGHTGSLDPLATGMLPICFGAATKLAGYLLDARKTYSVTAELGVATDTGDADGAVTARSDAPAPSEARLRTALAAFVGEIEQTPPMHSALKHDGRRLYELARRGVVVERKPRRVRIFAATLDEYVWPRCRFTVTCSKGTYIRSLVADLASEAGTLGHVAALRRLAVEPFREADMVGLEALEAAAASGLSALDAFLLPLDAALPDWPSVEVDAADALRLSQGQAVPAGPAWPRGLVRIQARGAGMIGIGEVLPEGRLAPRRWLA